MEDFTTQFFEEMRSKGFVPKNGKVVPDDKWHPAYYGEEKGKKCSGTYTMKIVGGDFAIGCFFTRKDPENKHNWHSKSIRQTTAAERRREKQALAKYKKEKEEAEEKKFEKISRLLTKAYSGTSFKTIRDVSHIYLLNKKVKAVRGLKIRKKTGELIVPLFAPNGKVSTLQKINENGGKYLFRGGKKKGCYFSIAKKEDDFKFILICEGLATGLSIREATGLPVAVAIDSGNLRYALYTLKVKFPKSIFVICADNDAWVFHNKKKPKDIDTKAMKADDKRWNEWREAGYLWNVGIEKAREAAAEAGGVSVIWPCFDGLDVTDRPTDFNDLHVLAGLGAVDEQIKTAIKRIPAEGEAAEGSEATHATDQQPLGGDYFPPNAAYLSPDYQTESPLEDPQEDHRKVVGDLNGMSFRCLGYNEGSYFYFLFKEREVACLSASAHTMQNLLRFDSQEKWDAYAAGAGEKISPAKLALLAQNAMIRTCQSRGVFRPDQGVRGGGAWIDNKRFVFNCGGNTLLVNGKLMSVMDLESEYTYVDTYKILDPKKTTPLSDIEAMTLRKILDLVSWENKLSSVLLSGWIVVAPLCGALEAKNGLQYRPHIWITGQSNSGKSTIIDSIIKVMLRKVGLLFDQNTTEAAIRELSKSDARPLVLDEAEPKDTTEAVIELARLATTGGTIVKYGRMPFRAQFCACFSGVNPNVKKTADETRISFLKIIKNEKPTAIEDYNKIMSLISEHITVEYGSRMLMRTIKNFDTLRKNIEIFTKEARVVLKNARAAQQIGTLLAGARLLVSNEVIDAEIAGKMISKYDWSDYTAINNKSESDNVLDYISSALVKYNGDGFVKEWTIGEIISSCMDERNPKEGDKFLRRYGIAIDKNYIVFAVKSKNLQHLLRGTDWVQSYSSRLMEIDGAVKRNTPFYFTGGVRTSAVLIPKIYFRSEPQASLDFEPEDREISF